MIINAQAIAAQLSRIPALARRILPKGAGRHVADSLASADWYQRMQTIPASSARLSGPRIRPELLTLSDRVMRAYDEAERAMTDRLNAVMLMSALNWQQSHA